jgi:hypothetical protein
MFGHPIPGPTPQVPPADVHSSLGFEQAATVIRRMANTTFIFAFMEWVKARAVPNARTPRVRVPQPGVGASRQTKAFMSRLRRMARAAAASEDQPPDVALCAMR